MARCKVCGAIGVKAFNCPYLPNHNRLLKTKKKFKVPNEDLSQQDLNTLRKIVKGSRAKQPYMTPRSICDIIKVNED